MLKRLSIGSKLALITITLSAVLVGLTAWRLFSKRAAMIAGFGMAIYAPAIFFDGLIQKSVLDVFFMSLSVWLLSVLVFSPDRTGRWFALGAALGGLSLTRENALALVAVVAGWALVGIRGPLQNRMKSGAVLPEPRPRSGTSDVTETKRTTGAGSQPSSASTITSSPRRSATSRWFGGLSSVGALTTVIVGGPVSDTTRSCGMSHQSPRAMPVVAVSTCPSPSKSAARKGVPSWRHAPGGSSARSRSPASARGGG